MDIKKCSLTTFFLISTICVYIITLYAQEAFRKEWSDFQGYYGASIPSAIYTGEVSEASNVILENGVLETALGISSVSTPVNPSGCVVAGFVPYQNTSKQTLIYWCANFGSWQEMSTTNSSSYLRYTIGQASVSVNGLTVYGSLTDWFVNIKAGDYWRCGADAESDYTEISSVVSNTSMTLTGAYTGTSCNTLAAYRIRKTLAGTSAGAAGRNFYQGSVLNGWALLATGTENPEMYDGTDLYTNVGISSIGAVATHKNRWFGGGTSANPDNLFWSPVNSTAAWDSTAFEPIFSADGAGGIVSIVSDDSSLVIFKRFGKIYRVYGEFLSAIGRPDTTLEIPTSYTLGEIAPKTVVKYNNAIWFLSTRGLYALRGNDIKLMGRNFNTEITAACVTNLTCNMGNQFQVFSGVYDNKLFINMDNNLVLIDSEGNAIQRNSLGDTLYGGFSNFNNNLYTSNETSAIRILRMEIPSDFSLYDDDGSTNSVNMSYISDSYCGDLPEQQKEFKDFYILYEQDASSITGGVGLNQILFDALINDTTTYLTVSSITTNGPNTSVGRIAQATYRVGTKGNCIRWRIRENSNGRRNRIVKVVLRGNNLNLR